MSDWTPAQLAAADRKVAEAETILSFLVDSYPAMLAANGGRTQVIANMGYTSMSHFDHDDRALLLAIAVAQLAERGPAADVLARHAVEAITRTNSGETDALCHCGAIVTSFDYDAAVAELDRHIANPGEVR